MDGADRREWLTAEDWLTGEVPTSADVACIGSGKTVTISEAEHAEVLENKGTLVLRSGSLELAGVLPEDTSHFNSLMMSGGSLIIAGEVDVTGSFSGGGKISGPGTFVIEPGVSATVNGSGRAPLTLDEVAFKNAGTLTVSGPEAAAAINGENNAVLSNSGTFVLNTIGYSLRGPAGTKFVNTGTFTQTEGSWTTTVQMPIENSSSVSTSAGKLEWVSKITSGEGSWSSSGTETAIVFNATSETSMLGKKTTFSGNVEVNHRQSTSRKARSQQRFRYCERRCLRNGRRSRN